MTLHEVTNVFSHVLRSFAGQFTGKSNLIKYGKQVGLALSVVALLGAGFLGYRWYFVHKQQGAQKQFAEYFLEYNKAMREEVKDWDSVEMLFKLGAQQQANTSFGPYFLAFQVQALLQQGKKDEALQVMDSMIQTLPSDSPLFTLFKTKRALMRLDMSDAKIKETGVQELAELARDTKNTQRDVALFYLGHYYWVNDNLSEAKKAWQELTDQFRQEMLAPSPWVQLAQSKLNQMVS